MRGVNLPWFSYGQDFGRSAWSPHGGVAQQDARVALDRTFARLAAAGVTLVRWFLLCDGRAGLCEADDGTLEGLDDRAFEDLKVAVAVAEAHGLALMPTLLDFHWCRPRRNVDGVRCGGRAHHLVDAGARTHLLQHVIRPLLSRFGGRAGIAAWDVINEPEWVTFSWRSWDPRHPVLPDHMTDFLGDAVALVHECTDHPVTVGLASIASLPLVKGLGLDFYQVHWYDKLDRAVPLETPVTTFAADVPVVLGEFPSRGSRRSPVGIEDTARAAGYMGVMAWSLCATDEASSADAIWEWLEGPRPGAR